MAEMKMYARGPKEKPKMYFKDTGEGRRKTLMLRRDELESELEKMGNPPKGGFSKKLTDRRRTIRTLLKNIATELGTMDAPDKDFP